MIITFLKLTLKNNLEKFYQYYISKDTLLNIEHKPKLVCSDKEVNIVYQETDEYKQKVENQKHRIESRRNLFQREY